jgi:hypothetical protein
MSRVVIRLSIAAHIGMQGYTKPEPLRTNRAPAGLARQTAHLILFGVERLWLGLGEGDGHCSGHPFAISARLLLSAKSGVSAARMKNRHP